MNFQINLIFLIKSFLQHDKNILRTKRVFKMKKKSFFIIFKGLSMKQKAEFFLEGESPTLSNFYL